MNDDEKTTEQLLDELTRVRMRLTELEETEKERRRADCLVRLQRDLALALGATSSMEEALDRLLAAILHIDGIDSGGVYLVDSVHGDLQLVSHTGLSSSFIDRVLRYSPETPQAHLVMKGESTYWPDVRGVLGTGALLEEAGLTALAVIPGSSEGRVVAALNLASHTHRELPETTRRAIETIAAQIGGIVSRVGAEEALKAERQKLAELNAALKILLRQRDEDRTELESALLINVKNLVLPYVEKLRNTRMTPEQALSLELIQTHLREITSPFLRKLSHQFATLTPMEIRVANLIRDGRTTKEIVGFLGATERSVLFYRQSLRRKLGLKNEKANLRSFLLSLS